MLQKHPCMVQGWRLVCKVGGEGRRWMINKVPLDGSLQVSYRVSEKFTKMLSMHEFKRVGTFMVQVKVYGSKLVKNKNKLYNSDLPLRAFKYLNLPLMAMKDYITSFEITLIYSHFKILK